MSSYMAIQFARRNNSADLRWLDHRTPAQLRNPGINLRRIRIMARAYAINAAIEQYNLLERMARLAAGMESVVWQEVIADCGNPNCEIHGKHQTH